MSSIRRSRAERPFALAIAQASAGDDLPHPRGDRRRVGRGQLLDRLRHALELAFVVRRAPTQLDRHVVEPIGQAEKGIAAPQLHAGIEPALAQGDRGPGELPLGAGRSMSLEDAEHEHAEDEDDRPAEDQARLPTIARFERTGESGRVDEQGLGAGPRRRVEGHVQRHEQHEGQTGRREPEP